MQFELNIPENLSEIKLSQYQQFAKLPTDLDEMSLMLNMVKIFTNVNDPTKLQLATITETATHLSGLLETSNDLIQRFTLGTGSSKTEFGFIPSLEEMSFGEYIDLEDKLNSWDTFHEAMAIMYRPVTKSTKYLYNIEAYSSSAKYAEVMKHAPMNVVMGAMVFFWNLENQLLVNTQSFLEKKLKQIPNNQTSQVGDNLIKSGAGIVQSLNSLITMLPSSMPSLAYRSNNVFCNSFSKKKKQN